MPRPTVEEKRKAFWQLHRDGCFVMPNPWDCGSAKALVAMGFPAVATTSAGFAWTTGQPDGRLSRASVLSHMRAMVEAVDVPVNADFESGFANTLSTLEDSVRLAIETGVAGFSLEDSTGDSKAPLMSVEEAATRISLARTVIDGSGSNILLVGRAENFFVGVHDLDDVLNRLRAYSEAGADCLYAPGIKTREQIKAVVEAVAPKPVNVLIGWNSDLTVKDIAALGVRRISVGGAMARAAWGGFLRAAQLIQESGRFDGFADTPAAADVHKLLE